MPSNAHSRASSMPSEASPRRAFKRVLNALRRRPSSRLKSIREALEVSVKKRLMSEVPYGVLLSGGLDSSIIAAVAARETEKVARAQVEAMQTRLAQGKSGLVSPPSEGDPYSGVTEEGEAVGSLFFPSLSLRHVGQPPLPLGRGCTHFRSAWSIPLTCSPHGKQLTIWARIRIRRARRPGRHSRRNIPSGNV
jgi:Asparagine synthase